jgi:hypothetical protein
MMNKPRRCGEAPGDVIQEATMYCIDTLKRLNNVEVAKERKKAGKKNVDCEFCGEKATRVLPVYNPADAVRKVKGAYCTIEVCDNCYEDQKFLQDDEYFYCDDCGELFITHHSWDSLVCNLEEGRFCHACAAKRIEPLTLDEIIEQLKNEKTESWKRINAVPDKDEVWTGEYSGYSDFPGHTSFASIIGEIKAKAEAEGWAKKKLYPVISQAYQFSVVLSIFA